MSLPDLSLDHEEIETGPTEVDDPAAHICADCGGDTLRQDATCSNSVCPGFVPQGAGVFTP